MVVLFSACSLTDVSAGSTPAGSLSPTISTADPTAGPSATPSLSALDMTQPGVASKVIKRILSEVKDQPVVKVDVKKHSVVVTFITEAKKVKAYSWVNEELVAVDSDVTDISQARFDPREFNLSDVGKLFAEAEKLGTSSLEQELQIVEHDRGEVLMSVTTRPESATVFFRKDGTPIQHTDVETIAGMKAGLGDALGQYHNVYAIGFDPAIGVWVDVPNPDDGTLIRRTRQTKLPTYSAARNQKPVWATFAATDVDLAVIHRVRAELRTRFQLSPDTPIVVTVDGQLQRSTPTITFKAGPKTVVTDLRGTDITAWVS